MEIPQNLRVLYKHWDKHSTQELSEFNKQNETNKINTIQPPEELVWFITERMRIWEKKQKGEFPPYTDNEILTKYRFCNIYRELDRQTIEIHEQIKDLRNDFPLWLLNIALHRFVCKPVTIKDIGLLSFDKKNNTDVYNRLLSLPKPKYGTPYVFPISVIQNSDYHTREEFFCFYLPKVIPVIAEIVLNKFDNISVNKALQNILPIFKFNFRFHWTEILIDVAYQYPELINLYSDFYIGPGAIPTAKKIMPDIDPIKAVDSYAGINLKDFPYLTYNGKPINLSAENWEGIFCEYRKYTNLKNGQGRIRRYR